MCNHENTVKEKTRSSRFHGKGCGIVVTPGDEIRVFVRCKDCGKFLTTYKYKLGKVGVGDAL